MINSTNEIIVNKFYICNIIRRIFQLSIGIVVFLLINEHSVAQESIFRRHFLIFYDVSGSFQSIIRNDSTVSNGLISLFRNDQIATKVCIKNYLVSENQPLFFDVNNDEITIFDFGLSETDFNYLRYNRNRLKDVNRLYPEFKNRFIKKVGVSFSEYCNLKKDFDVREYLMSCLDRPRSNFGNGITLSNIVPSIGIEYLNTHSYSREYIILVVSDFLHGSTFGNNRDFQLIEQMLHYENDCSDQIIRSIEKNDQYFQRIECLECQYQVEKKGRSFLLGIFGERLKPLCGYYEPDNISLSINSDIILKQKEPGSFKFFLSETNFNFLKNDSLELKGLDIYLNTRKNNFYPNKEPNQFTIAGDFSEKNRDEISISTDNRETNYLLPKIELAFPSLAKSIETKSQILNFDFITSYIFNNHSLGFVWTTSRSIDIQNVKYATKLMNIIMQVFGILGLCLLFFILLFRLGKPKTLEISMQKINDNFEDFDLKKGRKKYELISMDTKAKEYPILLSLFIPKTFFINIFWRNIPVYVGIQDVKLPQGYDIIISYKDSRFGERRIYSTSEDLKIDCKVGVKSVLKLILQRNSSLSNGQDIETLAFKIGASYNQTKIFTASFSKVLPQVYKISNMLDDVWVGIDPGTTGSCFVSGKDSQNLYIEKDNDGKDYIVPSIVSIDTHKEVSVEINNKNLLLAPFIECGETALQTISDQIQYRTFQSIKKLLGFKNKEPVSFENGKTIEFNGTILTSILINYVYTRHKKETEAKQIRGSLSNDNTFTPQRAVFAIPNNFTATKISALENSVRELSYFEEIRYIYEADAVLVSYLFNTPERERKEKELIMIFDMGGATINVTLSRITRKKIDSGHTYVIDSLARLGYGIGGDTIDYYLIKLLFDKVKDQKNIDPFEKFSKSKLQLASLELKKRIIANFNDSTKTELLISFDIESFYNRLNLNVEVNDDINELFKVPKNRKIDLCESFVLQNNIFNHEYLKKHIFDEVTNIVKDALMLCPSDEKIGSIIFSGRSTAFPGIRSSVKRAFNSKDDPEFKSFDFDSLKSVVARGACLYGLNRNSIEINNLKTNCSFGFKHSPDLGEVNFKNLIPIGSTFTLNGGLGYAGKKINMKDSFNNDALSVNFYQIMGAESDKILKSNQKHKISLLSRINVQTETKEIGMTVWENDHVDCFIEEMNSNIVKTGQTITDEDIYDANDPHYTWMVE